MGGLKKTILEIFVTDHYYRIPENIYWDTDEPRLLSFEIKSSSESQEKGVKSMGSSYVESKVLVMFVSEKQTSLNILERSSLATGEKLINLCVPNIVSF